MLLDLLKTKKPEIESLAIAYGANRIRIFGSVVRHEDTPKSDVDLLVDFPKGYDIFSQRLPLSNDLTELIGRKVDLVVEHELNPHFRQYIIQEAQQL